MMLHEFDVKMEIDFFFHKLAEKQFCSIFYIGEREVEPISLCNTVKN